MIVVALMWVSIAWFVQVASAATLTVASCTGSSDHTKVQTQVNAAVDDDIVQIQAGNCTFSAPVTWSNKNITVQGAGQGVTNVTSNAGSAFAITPSTKAGFRITAMSISSTSNDPTIDIDAFNASSVIADKFRLDHLTMTQTQSVSGSPRTFSIQGLVYGLIDHVTATATGSDPSGFDWTHTFVELNAQSTADNYPTNFAGHVAANLPVTLGDANAIYVEDSSFTVNEYGVINNITYGARMVMRHNTFTGPQHTQTHSTRGDERGGVRSEYYNNVFDCQDHVNCPGAANMISGTGVMFNNTIKNNANGNAQGVGLILGFQRCASTGCTVSTSPLLTCSTSSGYDGGTEANGWPCADQPGWTGTLQSQTNTPIYIWNNGSADGCSTGGSCAADHGVSINCVGEGAVGAKPEDYIKTTTHTNGAKDYCVGTTSMPGSCGTHTNTYSAYTYPHPLQGVSSPAGSHPSGGKKLAPMINLRHGS